MPKGGALFVMVDSDIDDEELQSLVYCGNQKMKLCRKRTLDNRKMASVVSSLASTSASDSDSNTTSSVSSVSSTFSTKRGMKRKAERQTVDGVAGKADPSHIHSASKKSKTDTKVCDVSNSDSYPRNSKSLSHLNGTKHVHLPNVWRTVNSSHYIFSSDEDSETESKVRNSYFSQNVSATSNGKRTSQLWRKSDGDPFNQTKNKLFSPNAHDAGSEKSSSSSSCLTACKSCKAYSLPDLPEQDCSEMKCYVALDCEFVGVGASKKSSLGRCSIVDHRGEIIFDRFVKPPEEVTDYRTPWSGLRARNIRCGIPLVAAQEMISAVIKDKIVIGHAVHNDFRVMGISHPVHLIRDTASCKLLREMANMPSNVCALRKLTAALLGRTIQKKEHCSVTDARACLDLFRLVRTQWEPVLQSKLQRRLERQSGDKDNAPGSVVTSDKNPELHSYFDDEYWPQDLFN